MADYNINAVTRRVVYSGSAGLGPYSFSFEVLDQDDLAVYFNTTKLTLTTDYTVTINANGTGSITIVTGTNVPSTPTGSDTIIIVGARDIERVTDFVTAGDLRASALNEQLDGLTIFDQQIAEEQKRTLQAPVYDPAHVDDGGTLDMTLPAKSARAGKYLQFNSTTGNPEAGPDSTDVTNLADVATDIALLADIQDGTTATNAITTVSGISANVTTVAGIASNVSTVAGISADVTSVAADATDIGTVATNIASVNTVAGNISEVVAVANDLNEAVSEVETVANDLNEAVSEIETVAASISNVDAVGTNIANVNTVAGIDSNVTTVAGISANVTTVAGISANVTTVAGISADVSTVAADGTDIGTVAGISSNVSTVAGISGDVTTVAGVSSNVTTVATDITNVKTVATNIADVNNFALTYRIAASAPATSLDEGDLYLDTTQNKMFVYDGSAWVTVSPDLIADTTPQLGGNLDLNGNNITGTGNISTTGTATFTGDLTVDTNTLYVDSTNNRVGLGTSSPSYLIDAQTAAGNAQVQIKSGGDLAQVILHSTDTTGNSQINFADADSSNVGMLQYFHSDNHMEFTVNSSEAMRIDSSGDAIIGGTTAGASSAVTISGDGYVQARYSSGPAAYFDRLSTDGTIAEFRKDGSAVGSIGSRGAGTSYIILKSSAGAGAGLTGSDNAILPMDESALADANTSLGNGSYRFKDLHWSNSVLVGATSGRGGAATGHLFKMPSGDVYFEIMGSTTSANTDILFSDGTGGSYGVVGYDHTNDALRFFTNSGERMRIDSSGNLLVGKTTTALNTNGIRFVGNDTSNMTVSGGTVLDLNRRTSDGSILGFYKDGSSVGNIGYGSTEFRITSSNGYLVLNNSSSGYLEFLNSGYTGTPRTRPDTDNAYDLGDSGRRFDDIFATNGTIQTSDANEKQQIAALTDAEITAAKAISQLFKTFKWNDKVAAKGDAARTHTGVIAQDVEAAMTAAGLDAGDYAFFISTDWYVDADGNEVEADAEGAIAKNRKGIRYPELLSFVGAATEQRLANIETRLAALEAN